jgi:hypothetical protein
LYRAARPESGREGREVFQGVPDRPARSNSERAGPSACVGKRYSAVRLADEREAPLPAGG